jgi:hypothetical protein
MALHVHVTDSSTQKHAHVAGLNDPEYRHGLIVATEPLRQYENQGKIFLNPQFGINMNIAAGVVGGTPVVAYSENVEWVGSNISGIGFVFNSGPSGGVTPLDGSGIEDSGSLMIDAVASTNNNIMQLTSPSDVDLSDYVSISGYINVASWPTTGTKEVLLSGWDAGAGAIVGGPAINLGNYITIGATGIWQKFTVPLSDLNLEGQTIDAIRITTIDIGGGDAPNYYLDLIKIEQESTSGEVSSAAYTVIPDKGTWYFVNNIRFVLAAPLAGTVSDGTMTGLAYDKILNLDALTSGILYQRLRFDEPQTSFIIRQFSDMLSIPDATYQATSDGTNTLLMVDLPFTTPLILRSENQDELRLTVLDDLSELLLFRTFVGGWKEDREVSSLD